MLSFFILPVFVIGFLTSNTCDLGHQARNTCAEVLSKNADILREESKNLDEN